MRKEPDLYPAPFEYLGDEKMQNFFSADCCYCWNSCMSKQMRNIIYLCQMFCIFGNAMASTRGGKVFIVISNF